MTNPICPGYVLWIEPSQCALPGMVDGFALRVDVLLGIEGQDARGIGQVRVGGRYHDGRRWCGVLELRVPFDQALAEPDVPGEPPEVVEHGGKTFQRVHFAH